MPGSKSTSSLLAAEVGDVVTAPDGLPASVVSDWTEEKHYYLRTYLKLHSAVRPRWTSKGNATTYIDLYCGHGCALIEGTERFIEGSPVAAWVASREHGQPFTAVYIADVYEECLRACEQRLKALDAPVKAFHGSALDAAESLVDELSEYGFHFAFLDPYSLGQLDFGIIKALANFKHIDMLANVCAMDLFRNLTKNETDERQQFELFAPGWKEHVNPKLPDHDRRRQVVEYWQSLVRGLDLEVTAEMPAIKNRVNRDLYWLTLLTRASLAKKFWKEIGKYKRGDTADMFGH